MAEYVPAKCFREFKEFTITKVYPFYRSGGVMVGGKFIGKTFKLIDGKWQEEFWVDGDGGKRKPEYRDTDIKMDREFFKVYKKVFDVAITTPNEVTIGEEKSPPGFTGTEFVIKRLGAFKIREMLREDFTLEIPMDDKEREAFDWEDNEYERLEGKTFLMKVTGQLLDTKYKFKLVEGKDVDTFTLDDDKPAEKEKINPEDELPF